ncbi:TraY domain-containing protein [Serratia nevei]|uniref:TraY domain-containing protein n=1 Tax=Serratia TaxID=613 RepID=UPI0013DAD2C6|nr:TraY domain-containing protein [Serratia marcescens]MBH3259233.1 TraY domain-containing protein [Serratia marcescens]MBL0875164.1 TraY domain-containing protein [Serratia nevei]MDP8623002.1 TraY domain-containing protein [Serratia marcescens]
MKKLTSNHEFRNVTLTLEINARVNELLSRSAERSGRTKRQEALLRLEDHLNEFVDIAATGKRFSR